jgi:hypothetical protein
MRHKAEAAIHSDGTDIFVSVDGVNIAKRGSPNTPQAKTWVSLEPGWSVVDVDFPNGIEVSYQGVRVHGDTHMGRRG